MFLTFSVCQALILIWSSSGPVGSCRVLLRVEWFCGKYLGVKHSAFGLMEVLDSKWWEASKQLHFYSEGNCLDQSLRRVLQNTNMVSLWRPQPGPWSEHVNLPQVLFAGQYLYFWYFKYNKKPALLIYVKLITSQREEQFVKLAADHTFMLDHWATRQDLRYLNFEYPHPLISLTYCVSCRYIDLCIELQDARSHLIVFCTRMWNQVDL